MKKDGSEVIINFLNKKNMKIIQRNDYLNFSLDSVLVANFMRVNRKIKKVIDLGTGNGVIPMILGQNKYLDITGIEIQKTSANLANRNIELNNLEKNIKIITNDIKNFKSLFKAQSYDSVICNPPFFKLSENKNQLNNLEQLSIARHEISITLEDILEATSYLLRSNGYFTIVHRTERVLEIFDLMRKYNIQPKKVQFCHSKLKKPSKTVLIEGIKFGKNNLEVLPPIYTHNENGEYSNLVLNMFN